MPLERDRARMVERQIAARGIGNPLVLEAMHRVPREAFLEPAFAEFAYEDSPLPIEEGQTISQPYIVALMVQAAELQPGDKALEIGTGSGYAAAIMACIARQVFTIERHASLAETARRRLEGAGFHNVQVRHGDGTRGWPEEAPFDAILVAAAGPEPPPSLQQQLSSGGRLVIPVGEPGRGQRLLRIVRTGADFFAREDLGGVAFVPLIGAEGWDEQGRRAKPAAAAPAKSRDAARTPFLSRMLRRAPARRETPAGLPRLIAETAEPIADADSPELAPLLERIGDARVVLIGEATHGTSEFYRCRAAITRALIERKGFTAVCLEADWPDAAQLDDHVRGRAGPPPREPAFARFPTWMWRNLEVRDFVDWLHARNHALADRDKRAGIFGLDLYSLSASIQAVLDYLRRVDPAAARIATERYGCLTPWQQDPASYGRATLSDRYRSCEEEVVAALEDLLARRLDYARADGEDFLDAAQNARLVANAETYYRAIYYGAVESWNVRDSHMFETLRTILDWQGPASRAVVWAHNSHVGNAAATEMGARREHNIGQLAREAFGAGAYILGFGTDRGTVAAASDWDGPMEVKRVRPAHAESYERLCHDSGAPAFLLPLRHPARTELPQALMEPRLERAIGVIYRPETELLSHYFQAILPQQFDEYVWFDETRAVTPLAAQHLAGMPDTYPFGL